MNRDEIALRIFVGFLKDKDLNYLIRNEPKIADSNIKKAFILADWFIEEANSKAKNKVWNPASPPSDTYDGR